ncbi:MAG: SH3 domain-containing protein [Agathobacter sp.]|nr:SH3 domain-containing protein [Agathobacter sp.]
MKLNRKMVEGAIVVCLTGALTITSLTSNGNIPAANTVDKSVSVNTGLENDGIAGVAAILNDYELEAAEQLDNLVFVEKEELDIVAAAMDETEEVITDDAVVSTDETTGSEVVTEESSAAEEAVLTAEEQEWQNYLMPNVKKSLNVRAEASEEAAVVGKLYKGDKAVIVEKGSEWIKITSGNVEGYVKSAYCLTGSEAYAYAQENCETVAKSTTNGLRVRKEQSTEAEIVKTIGKGDTLTVDTKAEVSEGWVAVTVKSATCYVSDDYVEVSIKTGTGVTLQEEKEAEEKAAAEKKAAEAKKNQKSSSGKTQGSSLAASVDEVTLLAALIQCEVGGQPYDCQVAVGAVVVNRIKSSSHPNTMYKVIYQSGQFGPASSGKLENRLKKGVSPSCMAAAQEALSGVDNTGGAKYFKLASSGHAGVVIGALVFY